MRLLLIFAAALPLICCANSDADHRPLDWPIGPNSTLGCSGVAGNYLDPNAVRGSTIVYHNEHSWSETGGTGDSAWLVFGFFNKSVSTDRRVKGRGFSLEFDANDSLIITYKINGKVISSKEILSSDHRCEQGVLKFISYHRDGYAVYDKLPNNGSILNIVELFRANDYLYVRHLSKTKAVFYGFIPSSHTQVSWPRFPAFPAPAVPMVPPARSFPWDISKKSSVVEKEFIVMERRIYQFDIEFHYNGLPDDWRNFMGTTQFVDTGRDIFFTKDMLHPRRLYPQDVGSEDRLVELYQKGEIVKKRAVPGVIVPVYIRLEKIDETVGSSTKIIEETVNTEGLSHAGGDIYSRKISAAELRPGRYKITAQTLIDVPLPPRRNAETYTALGIYYDPNVQVNK